ncbi:hypothetical protein TraAM80_00656 [Trypanosoma rangeli]|uniref:Enriched in surface-labeled proteome protein 18 n=1 Tax=Trypanosoma rangeli TaxID=5698 RepID=A0A3R7NU99_TRYRA|nr:uncharacterized protein TraAM80_00656 [Trypanosoma rangeli]RNF11822.1 hypothetical protein TraAM80_00656 [Trypanosoma rangeli]|eukprot:RNF11822.1 hypothetical protein TraAM80_00656 [Trypanosoma rangeli]
MRGVSIVCFFLCVTLAFQVLPLHAEPSPIPARAQRSSTQKIPFRASPTDLLVFPFSACDADVKQLCPTQKESPLKCLLQHFESQRSSEYPWRRRPAFSKACSRWLWARQECVSYVRLAGKCRVSESARDCLRRVPPRDLPPGCRDTEYYRSVLLYGEMKRTQRMRPPEKSKENRTEQHAE